MAKKLGISFVIGLVFAWIACSLDGINPRMNLFAYGYAVFAYTVFSYLFAVTLTTSTLSVARRVFCFFGGLGIGAMFIGFGFLDDWLLHHGEPHKISVIGVSIFWLLFSGVGISFLLERKKKTNQQSSTR